MSLADLNVAEDLVHRGFVYDWADLGFRIEAVADTQELGFLDERGAEFFIDLFVNDEPRRRGASLAARSERTPQRTFDGVVDVGIVHHDDGVLSAHFETDDLVVAGALFGDDLAGRGRACERDQPNVFMSDHRRSDVLAVAVDEVDDTLGYSSLFACFDQIQ